MSKPAHGDAVLRQGGRYSVHLAPVPPEQRALILREYVRIALSGRRHFPLDAEAPLSEFCRDRRTLSRVSDRSCVRATCTGRNRRVCGPPAKPRAVAMHSVPWHKLSIARRSIPTAGRAAEPCAFHLIRR